VATGARHSRDGTPSPSAWLPMDKLIESDQDYQAAREFAVSYRGKPGVDYAWVYDYARREYDIVAEGVKAVESKADTVVQYLGGASGALTLVSAFMADKSWELALLTVPSVVAALLAFEASLGARRPEKTPGPPATKHALELADTSCTTAEALARAAARIFEAASAMRVVGHTRGKRLEAAYARATWALGLLLVPLAGAALLAFLK
jgi:hypothetical protein